MALNPYPTVLTRAGPHPSLWGGCSRPGRPVKAVLAADEDRLAFRIPPSRILGAPL